MSARLAVITECWRCPHGTPAGEGAVCTFDNAYRKLPRSAGPTTGARIPSWCPLPGAPKKRRRS